MHALEQVGRERRQVQAQHANDQGSVVCRRSFRLAAQSGWEMLNRWKGAHPQEDGGVFGVSQAAWGLGEGLPVWQSGDVLAEAPGKHLRNRTLPAGDVRGIRPHEALLPQAREQRSDGAGLLGVLILLLSAPRAHLQRALDRRRLPAAAPLQHAAQPERGHRPGQHLDVRDGLLQDAAPGLRRAHDEPEWRQRCHSPGPRQLPGEPLDAARLGRARRCRSRRCPRLQLHVVRQRPIGRRKPATPTEADDAACWTDGADGLAERDAARTGQRPAGADPAAASRQQHRSAAWTAAGPTASGGPHGAEHGELHADADAAAANDAAAAAATADAAGAAANATADVAGCAECASAGGAALCSTTPTISADAGPDGGVAETPAAAFAAAAGDGSAAGAADAAAGHAADAGDAPADAAVSSVAVAGGDLKFRDLGCGRLLGGLL
mmetsp:Transcript_38407/g.97441  ORF Transcript_38407/g.97441 Transcript_38407/m.97441 type:complete len:437 (+) Transcript_38407:846-2156(+)